MVPDTYGTLPEALPDGQLQVEHRDALHGQHDQVREKEGACGRRDIGRQKVRKEKALIETGERRGEESRDRKGIKRGNER